VCSEAGVNLALSRNGDASAREDKSGRLPSVDDLSSEEGRLVPIPSGVATDALRPPRQPEDE